MKKCVAVILLMCFLLCGCNMRSGQDVESPDSIAITTLGPAKVTGSLPAEVSIVNGEWNTVPSLIVGAFGSIDGSPVITFKISPTMKSSAIGGIDSEIELPAETDRDSETVSISELYGMIISNRNAQVLGYFPLGEAVDESLRETMVLYNDWDGSAEDIHAFPVYVCKDGDDYVLISLMDGSVFYPNGTMPKKITEIAIEVSAETESVQTSECGVALFKIMSAAELGYSIDLLAFIELE